MSIRRRGPVTRANSIFHENGSVSCPLSTNRWSNDAYYTIDASMFHLVEGRCWYVQRTNQFQSHTDIRSRCPETGKLLLLHQVLYGGEANARGYVVDHLLHWTDNRRQSVEFVTQQENIRRGGAIYHPGRQHRRSNG